MLEEVVVQVLEMRGEPAGRQSGVRVMSVLAGQQAPTADARRPCAYVVRWHDGWFHGGESRGMVQRSQQHSKRRQGRGVDYAYVRVPSKDAALAVETALIREMMARGFPMWSVHDARRA